MQSMLPSQVKLFTETGGMFTKHTPKTRKDCLMTLIMVRKKHLVEPKGSSYPTLQVWQQKQEVQWVLLALDVSGLRKASISNQVQTGLNWCFFFSTILLNKKKVDVHRIPQASELISSPLTFTTLGGRHFLQPRHPPTLERKLRHGCSCCCSVAKSCLTLQPPGLQQARFLCPPLSQGVCSNSYSLSW